MEEEDFGNSQVARVRKYLWNLTEYPETSWAAQVSSGKFAIGLYIILERHLRSPLCLWWSSPLSPSSSPPCPSWLLTWTWSCLTIKLEDMLHFLLRGGKRWESWRVFSSLVYQDSISLSEKFLWWNKMLWEERLYFYFYISVKKIPQNLNETCFNCLVGKSVTFRELLLWKLWMN